MRRFMLLEGSWRVEKERRNSAPSPAVPGSGENIYVTHTRGSLSYGLRVVQRRNVVGEVCEGGFR